MITVKQGGGRVDGNYQVLVPNYPAPQLISEKAPGSPDSPKRPKSTQNATKNIRLNVRKVHQS